MEPFKEAGTLHASTLNLTLSTVYLGGHLQYEQTSSSFLCTQCMGVATRQLLICHMPGLLYSLCHYLPLSHAHFSFLLLKSSLMQPLCILQSHLITVPQLSPSFTARHFIQPQLHKQFLYVGIRLSCILFSFAHALYVLYILQFTLCITVCCVCICVCIGYWYCVCILQVVKVNVHHFGSRCLSPACWVSFQRVMATG